MSGTVRGVSADRDRSALDSPPMASDGATTFRLQRDVDPARDHVRGGGAGGAVTVVSYGDLLCPYCRRLVPVLARLREALGDRLVYVFRHFPNERAHPGAELAARATEAAARQGRFWEMHDRIYGREPPITERVLLDFARELGLDVGPVHRRHARRRDPQERRGGPGGGARQRSDGHPDALRGRRALRRRVGLLLAPRVPRAPRGGPGEARGTGVREPPGVRGPRAAPGGRRGRRLRELAARRRLPRCRRVDARPRLERDGCR